jgi:probable diaminopimelate decarboxylase protein
MNKKVESYIKSIFSSNPAVVANPTCYIYDLEEITAKIEEIDKNKCNNVSLYYAMKANPNMDVLTHVIGHNGISGVEIASTGELEKAKAAGLDTSKVLFTGPGKTVVELEQSVREGLRFINVESVVEAIRIDQIADRVGVEKINVLLRVNIDYFLDGASEYMAGMSTKMGIDQSRFYDDYAVIAKLKHINVCGFHVFAADGVLDYNILLKYTDFVFKFVKEAEIVVGQIDVIDFGGGFGIDYTKSGKFFDTKKYFNGLDGLVRKYSFNEKEFILELGKFIVGSAGYYATQVVDIKDSKGMKHIVTAGGVNHMRLPIATDRKHPVYIVDMGIPKIYDKQIEVSNETVDIEGPLCMTEDKISWDEYIESAKIGDIVVLAQSGAYCYSASTLWFLSHQIPLELIIKQV